MILSDVWTGTILSLKGKFSLSFWSVKQLSSSANPSSAWIEIETPGRFSEEKDETDLVMSV